MIGTFGPLKHERLHLILMGRRGEYLCDEEIATGIGGTLAGRFRPLIERALTRGARQLIVVHNHPSGTCFPSQADLLFTRNFAALCRTLDLELVDHLIVAGRSVFSMKRADLL